MSIRNISYYGWSTLLNRGATTINNSSSYSSASISNVSVSPGGSVYASAKLNIAYGSNPNTEVLYEIKNGISKEIFRAPSAVDYNSIACSDVDSSGSIYWFCLGNPIVSLNGSKLFKSTDAGKTFSSFITSAGLTLNLEQACSPEYLRINRNNDLMFMLARDNDGNTTAFYSVNSAGTILIDRTNPFAGIQGNYASQLDFDSSNNIYAAHRDGKWNPLNDDVGLAGTKATIYTSADNGSTWNGPVGGVYDTVAGSSNKLGAIAVSANDKIFHAGSILRADTGKWNILIRSSSDSAVSFGSQSYGNANTDYFGIGVDTDSNNNVYVAGISGSNSFILASFDGALTWNPIASEINQKTTAFYIDQNDKIYWSLKNTNNSTTSVKVGRLTANSASLGPRMLAPSFGWVQSEISGVLTEGFNLNNISEFPHSSGLFQMPNLVLGTKSSGRAGKTDDAIVQKRFIGSFVRILFPRQDTDQEAKGSDAGRKPGKLSSEWLWGDPIDIEGKNFDHLALNCVAKKEVSGTLDSILVRVETKPLGDSGYFIDQTIEQTISSSYSSEALYRDHVHRKDVDFGDLSLSEVSWKIEQDLTNIKSIRIGCKQKVGQNDDKNKQFLIIGRFITKDKNHNET